MRFGVLISIMLHLLVVAGILMPLPEWWRPKVEAEQYIPLELIREAELSLKTSVPAAQPEPAEIDEPEPEISEPEIEEPIEEFVPGEVKPEPVVEEPAPEPAPAPAKPEPKPEPPKEAPKPKPKPKNEELDFAALSQLIDKEKENAQPTRPNASPSQTTETADRARPAIGAGDRLTASVVAKMQSAVQPCWNAGAIIGAPEPEKLRVVLEFELNRDGTLVSAPRVENALQINLSGNQFWKVAEREAIAAVVKCAPYDFLPLDQYDTWKDMRLNFDPSAMVGR